MTDTAERLIHFPFPRTDPMQPPLEYARLRRERPVARVTLFDGSTAWLITRYDDVRRILHDREISADGSHPNLPHVSPAAAAAKQGQRFFSRMDPPEHDLHRRMLNAEFSTKAIERLRAQVVDLVDRLLTDMAEAGPPVDLVKVVAEPMPAIMTCGLLGVPVSDADFFSERLQRSLTYSLPPEEIRAAAADLQQYFADVVDDRAAHPRDDLVTRLVQAQMAEGKLTREELARMLWLLLIAGFDTSINVIGLGTLILLRNPKQADDLRSHPEIASNAVEEILRYTSVTHHVAIRLATRDMEVSGQMISAGEGLIAPLAAANWDPEVFPDPERLDLRRDNARSQVAFGYGIHTCLGQTLARLELGALFPELLRRFPSLALDGDDADLVYKSDAMIYGLHALPVRW